MSYKMALAEPQQGDEIIDTEGGRVIIDAKAILYLIGSILDVKQPSSRLHLFLKIPTKLLLAVAERVLNLSRLRRCIPDP